MTFESKDKNWGQKHDYKNLKDLDQTISQISSFLNE